MPPLPRSIRKTPTVLIKRPVPLECAVGRHPVMATTLGNSVCGMQAALDGTKPGTAVVPSGCRKAAPA